jgi:hypothetical protein
MGPAEPQGDGRSRVAARPDVQRQELFRLPRSAKPHGAALYSIFRYVSAIFSLRLAAPPPNFFTFGLHNKFKKDYFYLKTLESLLPLFLFLFLFLFFGTEERKLETRELTRLNI